MQKKAVINYLPRCSYHLLKGILKTFLQKTLKNYVCVFNWTNDKKFLVYCKGDILFRGTPCFVRFKTLSFT